MSTLIAVVHRELQGEALGLRGARRIDPLSDRLRVLVVDDDRELCERIVAEASSRDVHCDSAAQPTGERGR